MQNTIAKRPNSSNAQIVTPTKKTKKKRPSKNFSKSTNQKLAYKVPDCAVHYFHALVDPFGTPAGACVPADLFPLPSTKVKVYQRGTFQLGTTGYGWINTRFCGVNDFANTLHTTSTSVGGATTPNNAYTVQGNNTMFSLPYASADFSVGGGGIGCRPVGLGLRVKYIGKLADQSGVVVGYEEPDGSDVGGFSFNDVNSTPYSSISRVAQISDWDMEVCYSGPTKPFDVEFNSLNGHDPRNPSGSEWQFLLIMISGQPSDLYEFEVYQHCEYIGTKVANKTKTHSDPTSFSKISEAVKEKAGDGPIRPYQEKSLWDSFTSLMSKALPTIVDIGMGVGNMLVGNELGGGMLIAGAAKNLLTAPPVIRDRSLMLPALEAPSTVQTYRR